MTEEHESAIKTPRQLITVVVLSFLVPIITIIMLASYVASGARSGAGGTAMTPEAIEARIKPVAGFELRDASTPRQLHSGEEVFKAQCTTCHTAGVAGAPKFGDAAAWGPRIKTGLQTLVNAALKGMGAMPPQGGGDFDDAEIQRAVIYMANAGGAKFEEPAAPAKGADAAAPAGSAPAAAAPAATAAAPAAAPAPAATAAAAPAASTAVAGPVKLYFDTGKADLASDASKQLAAVVDAIKAGKAGKAVISGFHDKTGNAQQNAALAKERAEAVSKALKQAGLTDAQIDLRKPQETTGGGDNREARRVEVSAEKG